MTRHLEVFSIDIVRGCQLLCVGCPNSSIRLKVKDMPVDVFAGIMENFDGTTRRLRLFNYGEPLLHRDLPGIFKVLEKNKHKFSYLEITTNGQFVRWDQFEEILKTKLLGEVIISCDGDGTPESFERMRPPAKWDKLVNFLTKVGELRDKYHPDLHLSSRTVLLNSADAERWNALLHPLGWKTEFISWLRLPGATENMSAAPPKPGVGICHFLRNKTTYVSWDGTVLPCCGHPSAGDFGNITSQKWSSIQFGNAREEFVDTLKNRRETLNICSGCEFGSNFLRDPIP